LLEFFGTDSKSINLDGLFGIRIAEGMTINRPKKAMRIIFFFGNFLIGVINKLYGTGKFKGLDEVLNYKLKLSVYTIHERMGVLAKNATDSVKKQMPQYWNDFKLLVDKPYNSKQVNRFDVERRDSEKLVKGDSKPEKRFDEKFSDACLGLLMKDIGSELCSTEPDCFTYFLQENASGKNFL